MPFECPFIAPDELVLDFDATDNPLYGQQEQRFFHGYYDHYCYLPLYVFCGQQLLCAYLRPSRIDGAQHAAAILKLLTRRLRKAWPQVRIIIVGMTLAEGRMLLMDLIEHAAQRQFVHRHHWQPADLVMWDNTATMHRGRWFDFAQRRELRRATTLEAVATPTLPAQPAPDPNR